MLAQNHLREDWRLVDVVLLEKHMLVLLLLQVIIRVNLRLGHGELEPASD